MAIDLRAGDIRKMTSAVKSWIYQPELIKPQEALLYRDVKDGGLGLFNISARAKANLLVSFCKSALGYKCLLNPVPHNIYRFIVMEDYIKNPRRLPCFNEDFFNTIKVAVEEGIKVEELKVKEWYKRIVKNGITHH